MEQWIEQYGWIPSIIMTVVALTIGVLIIIRLQQSINRISKRTRRTAVDTMRQTSKYNKKERKKLTFDEDNSSSK